MRRLLALEGRQVLHGWGVATGAVGLIVAGVLALVFSSALIDRQHATLADRDHLQAEQHASVLRVAAPSAEAGDQLYYLFFHTAHVPGVWAPFAIGQRELQPYNLKVRLLALHGQLYDADLSNPLLTAFGHLDPAFAIVFLAPLLVIGLTYNVLSEERERGTWPLVRSQPTSVARVLALKLSVRGAMAAAPVGALLALVMLWLAVPLDARAAAVAGLTALYLLLWLAVAVAVVAFDRDSEFNAMALLTVWVLWVALGPALLNAAASWRHPVPDALELTVRQRQGYHASWDRPVNETMAIFHERFPEWREHPVPEDTYSNAWYYAMQERGDREAEPAARQYLATIEQRRQFVRRYAVLCPPALLQLAFDAVAGTDVASHVRYLDSVRSFHGELQRFFFPAIFDRTAVSAMNWAAAPRHSYTSEGSVADAIWPLAALGGQVSLAAAAAAVLAWRRSRPH